MNTCKALSLNTIDLTVEELEPRLEFGLFDWVEDVVDAVGDAISDAFDAIGDAFEDTSDFIEDTYWDIRYWSYHNLPRWFNIKPRTIYEYRW